MPKARGTGALAANQALLNAGSKYMRPLADDTIRTAADEEMQQYHKETPSNLLMPYMGVLQRIFSYLYGKGKRGCEAQAI